MRKGVSDAAISVRVVVLRVDGVEGVEVKFEECEFGYKTDRGVECYERMKGKGSIISHPNSTGLTYKLVPKAPVDEIPILTMGETSTSTKTRPYSLSWPALAAALQPPSVPPVGVV